MSRPRMENWGPTHQEEEDQFQKEKMNHLLEKDLHYQEHSAEPELLSEGNAGDRLANLYYHLINKAEERGFTVERPETPAQETRVLQDFLNHKDLPDIITEAVQEHRPDRPQNITQECIRETTHYMANAAVTGSMLNRFNPLPERTQERIDQLADTFAQAFNQGMEQRHPDRRAGPEERNEQQEKTDFQKQTEEYQEMLADNPEHNYLVAETPGERLASLLYHVCATAEERGFFQDYPDLQASQQKLMQDLLNSGDFPEIIAQTTLNHPMPEPMMPQETLEQRANELSIQMAHYAVIGTTIEERTQDLSDLQVESINKIHFSYMEGFIRGLTRTEQPEPEPVA